MVKQRRKLWPKLGDLVCALLMVAIASVLGLVGGGLWGLLAGGVFGTCMALVVYVIIPE